uniref:Uncharacterized protein n=1 Tax=Rhizophora mucronata TaxID=61149 RepID=A0A2P2P162_RHIMU
MTWKVLIKISNFCGTWKVHQIHGKIQLLPITW